MNTTRYQSRSGRCRWGSGLMAILLGLGSSLWAQQPMPTPVLAMPYGVPAVSAASAPSAPSYASSGTANGEYPVSLPATDGAMPQGLTTASGGVSSWLAYPRGALCCGGPGGDGPIQGEVFSRWGVAVPLGTNAFTTDMNVGFSFEIGARSLFFHPTLDRAWTVSFGLESTWNSITDGSTFEIFGEPVTSFDFFGQPRREFIPVQRVTPTRLHTTTLNITLGQEYYFWGNAACNGTSKCRIGWDVGGRVGKAKLDFAVERHRTDTVGGFLVSTHADYECPLGGCILYLGGRVTYGYTWMDILQRQNNTDFQQIGVYVNTGIRF
jgi:hypothetical protein